MTVTMPSTDHYEGTWAEATETLGYGLMLAVADPANEVEVRGPSGLKLLRVHSWPGGIEAVVVGGPQTLVMAGVGAAGQRELSRLGWMGPTRDLALWRRSWGRTEPLGAVARCILEALRGAFGADASSLTFDIVRSGL